MVDTRCARLSLGISIASLCVAVAAAYFTWTLSPFFDARPEHLSYWYVESNGLTQDKQPKTAGLKVVVFNNSARPAKDVLVAVTPLYSNAAIACDTNYDVLDGPKGSKLITIKRIAPKSMAEVHVSEEVKAYPERVSYFGGPRFRYCGSVNDVQTDFGAVRCEYPKCAETIERLPGDDGESVL